MHKYSSFAVFLLTLLLAGCSTPLPESEWSGELPEQAFFDDRYANDAENRERQSLDDYYTWVKRFYTGMNMVPGWLDMSEEVLSRVPADQQTEVRRQLEALGRDIGSEWAKNNEVRRIDNRMVSVWRDALTQAINENEVPAYLSRVHGDVRSLLYQDLAGEAIHYERYYQDSFEF